MDNVNDVVKAAIQTQILAAFKQGPDLIESLVKSALSQPVDPTTGRSDGYGTRVPYIDYIVGDTIRGATRHAVTKIVSEHTEQIEGFVRTGLNAETVVEAIKNAVVGAAASGWNINVKFETEKDR